MQRRRRRRGVVVKRRQLVVPIAPHAVRSMDFVSDSLEHGRRLKCLRIVDEFSKQSIDIVVDHGISGPRPASRHTHRPGTGMPVKLLLRPAVRRTPLSPGELRSRGLSLLLLTIAPLALAGPAPEEHCPVAVSTPEQTRWLADALYQQGAYQRAAECYEAAGDHALANKAFLRAVSPQSSTTKRQLSEQRDQAKALFRQVQHAFNAGD